MHCTCQLPGYFSTAQITRTRLDVNYRTSSLWTVSYCNAIILIYSEQIRCPTALDLRRDPDLGAMLCLNPFMLQVRLLNLPVLECNHSRIECPAAGPHHPFREAILSAGWILRAQRGGVVVFIGTLQLNPHLLESPRCPQYNC